MQTLYSRSVRQQDAIHTLKKCFVIKIPNLCQRVGWNFTRRAHVGVKRCNVTPALAVDWNPYPYPDKYIPAYAHYYWTWNINVKIYLCNTMCICNRQVKNVADPGIEPGTSRLPCGRSINQLSKPGRCPSPSRSPLPEVSNPWNRKKTKHPWFFPIAAQTTSNSWGDFHDTKFCNRQVKDVTDPEIEPGTSRLPCGRSIQLS